MSAGGPVVTPLRRAGLRGVVAVHRFGVFAVLAGVFSWSWWLPTLAAGGTASHAPGLLGPAVAGLVVTALADGRAGLARVGRACVRWRVPWRYAVAALAPLAVVAVAVLAARFRDGAAPSALEIVAIGGFPSGTVAGALLALLVVNGFGEEVGWRGVAWPALRHRHDLAAAALRLTLVWALWHVPTWWLATGMEGIPVWLLPGWLVGLAAGAVVLGWLVERTGSLLVAAVFHAGLNLASASALTEGTAAAVVTMAVVVAAVALLRRDAAERAASASTPNAPADHP